ncbi:hypothetical protein SAMN05519104_6694 [Rhizobiales bacterium GAS188]|nr:hypothetical protein SAMN05519104_6694 [Rhizobiales bacterium GAS188]
MKAFAVASLALCAAVLLYLSNGNARAQDDGVRWWSSRTIEDRITGATVNLAFVPATPTTLTPQRRPADTTKEAMLIIACRKGQIDVSLQVKASLIAGEGARATYRFDQEKPVESERWGNSEDDTAAVLLENGQASRFAKEAAKASTLLIRISHAVFGDTEAAFRMDNGKAASDVINGCSRPK